jgi:hypothetical protein
MTMNDQLLDSVSARAGYRCEYCHIPDITPIPHEVDHIIAIKHHGQATFENLALSCEHCNGCKSSNIAGIDPKTGRLTRLFDPRRHHWKRHFEWHGPIIFPRTPIGRVTEYVLNVNAIDRVILRQNLLDEGIFKS